MSSPGAGLLRLGLWREYRGRNAADGRLHGVRGLAVLIVVASHTGFAGLAGQGGLGVWLFFVLSGFLLAQPFLDDPPMAVSGKRLARFYLQRVRRLGPAYWVCVGLLYAPEMPAPWHFLRLNLLPIEGWQHLWSIRQELLLYLLLPAIMLPAMLLRGKPLMLAGVVLGSGLLVDRFVGPDALTLAGNGEAMRFYGFPFFAGIAGAALRRSSAIAAISTGWLSDAVTIGFLVGVFVTAPAHVGLAVGGEPLVWRALVASGLACLAVVLACGPQAGPVTRIVFGLAPLQICGLLAYGTYLIHPWVAAKALGAIVPRGTPLILVTLAGTVPLALLLYCWVERSLWRPRFTNG